MSIAYALARRGYDTTFLSVNYSWLTFLTRKFDYRVSRQFFRQRNRFTEVAPNLKQFAWFTPWHPRPSRFHWFERLTTRWFRNYGELRMPTAMEDICRTAKLFVIEKGCGIMLVPRLQRINPTAKIVYRVSDDLSYSLDHPVVCEADQAYAAKVDLVSVPSRSLYAKYSPRSRTKLMYHGLDKEVFDRDCKSPYPDDTVTKAVFVGNSALDVDAVRWAAEKCPNVQFHLIGPLENLPKASNVVKHGTIPFERTIPYVKHADVGFLFLRADLPGAECFADSSLKNMQYCYCGLPVVAPRLLDNGRHNYFHYDPTPESVKDAMAKAIAFAGKSVDQSWIKSWDEFVVDLEQEVFET